MLIWWIVWLIYHEEEYQKISLGFGLDAAGQMGSNFQPQRFEQKLESKKEGILPENQWLYKLILLPLQCWPFFGSLVDMLIFGEGILQIWQLRISPSWNWTEGYTQYSIYNTSYDYPLAATEIWHIKIIKEAGNPSLILTSGYFGMRICHGQVRNFFETTSHSQDPRLFTMLTFFIVLIMPRNWSSKMQRRCLFDYTLASCQYLFILERPYMENPCAMVFLNTANLGRFPSSKIGRSSSNM